MKKLFLYTCVGITAIAIIVVAVIFLNRPKKTEVPADIAEMCQRISDEKIEVGILFPQSMSPYVNVVDEKLDMRNDESELSVEIAMQLDGYNPDLRCILQFLFENQIDYFVCSKNDFFAAGCNWFSRQIVCETDCYYLVRILRDEYVVMQYASSSGSQSMIYTITNDKGDLVIVDGGYDVDAAFLENVIGIYDNHVSAWILSHPHPDHISAFNEIYKMGNVAIDAIYTNPIDADNYHEKAQEWDVIEVFDEFCQRTKDADNLVYLSEGDRLDLIGLDMQVFHSYDDIQMKDLPDPCNDGGLIFKLTGNEQSMLFLSDVGVSQTDYMVQTYGTSVKADYVQMGHHGNGGMSEEFYALVSPSVAFFDAPEWLMIDEKRNAPAKKRFMESMGAQVLDYSSAPNRVVIK